MFYMFNIYKSQSKHKFHNANKDIHFKMMDFVKLNGYT